jgi:hypothetical protein
MHAHGLQTVAAAALVLPWSENCKKQAGRIGFAIIKPGEWI